MTLIETIFKIKQELPHGYQKKIAAKSGVTRQNVNLFFKGRSKSERILQATIEIYEDFKKKEREIIERVERIAQ